jgi:hypothetical protein
MDTEAYFAQRDTPAADSPVARVMMRVLEKFPGITLPDAREKAHELLSDAASKRILKTPRVLSVEEQATEKAASAAYWKTRAEAKLAA